MGKNPARSRCRRWLSAVLLLAVLLLAVLAAGCSGESAQQVEADIAATSVPTVDPTATLPPTALPDPTPEPTETPVPPTPSPTPTATPEPLNVLTLDDAKAGVAGTNWIALPERIDTEPQTFDAAGLETTYYDSGLDGTLRPVFLATPTVWGNPHRLLVLSGTPDDEFVEVLVPASRPTGQTAWLRTADLVFESSDYVIGMDVAESTLEVWRNGEMVFFDEARERSQGSSPQVRNGVANYVEDVDFDREGFHPKLAAVSVVTPCDTCDYIAQVSIRGEGEGFDRDAFFALLEANGQIGVGYSLWITQEGLAEFMDLVPLGSRLEIVGGSDDPFGET